MFGRRKKMEKMTSMIGGLNITSKAALKQFCLLATQCNVKEATELYEFLIKDLDELPMFDPVQPTVMQNIKATANDVLSFFKENGNEISQGVQLIRGMFGKGGATATPVEPPIEPLQPIN